MDAILDVNAVSKSFSGRRALNAVSFSLPRGAVGGLIGPNGAGKTTLFSIVAGYLQPDTGTVSIGGQPSGAHPRGALSILPQDSNFQEGVSIEHQFYWYARTAGFDHEGAKVELRRVLELVDLVDAAPLTSDALSHGMHKRMAIAQALIGSPDLIILDEPTAGLDPANASTIRNLVRNLRGKRSLLVSSHNLDEVADLCDHVVILKQGEVVESKAMKHLVDQDRQVSFSLIRRLDQALLAKLKGVRGVIRVEQAAQGQSLTCELTASIEQDPEPLCEIVRLLCLAGAPFGAMTRGARLEDAFLQITGTASR